MSQAQLSAGGFLLRWIAALLLVLVTFNPTAYSYVNWVITDWSGDQLALKFLAGVVLAILYVIFLRATWRSIGLLGLTLAVLFFGAVIWVLIDFGWLDPQAGSVMAWLALVVIATILAIGMSWSHVRRRLAGQSDVDDVSD